MKKYIDQNKVRIQREAREGIGTLIEFGEEKDFVEAVKKWKPGISSQELKELISLFHAAKSERARGQRPR